MWQTTQETKRFNTTFEIGPNNNIIRPQFLNLEQCVADNSEKYSLSASLEYSTRLVGLVQGGEVKHGNVIFVSMILGELEVLDGQLAPSHRLGCFPSERPQRGLRDIGGSEQGG